MDVQFHKTMHPCLKRVKWECQAQEQTQEVKLTDGMPDIGRVLSTWGQVLIRSKEWNGGEISVSGGVMTWVMYLPEDGSEPRCIEGWIPFQMKCDFPNEQQDGTIGAMCLLRTIDARSVSAKKLIVRVGVSCQCEVFVPQEVELYSPVELPEDVQLLKNTYPMSLPTEAGEKAFLMDEVIDWPSTNPKIEKIIHYSIQPEIQDQKVMADKTVFRGNTIVRMLYVGDDGEFYSWDYELPFAQYAELEQEYGQDAIVRIIPAVTSLELDMGGEGQLHLKAGITGQYVVYEKTMLEIVEDAYSTKRMVELRKESLELPAVLDTQQQVVHADITTDIQGTRIVDIVFNPDNIQTLQKDDEVELSMRGQFQTLFYDLEHQLQCTVSRWEHQSTLSADQNCQVISIVRPNGMAKGNFTGGNLNCKADIYADIMTEANQEMPMVIGLQLSEITPRDKEQPSLILRKAGTDSLWDIAKQCNSTVEAISKANNLQASPEQEQVLLIPVV